MPVQTKGDPKIGDLVRVSDGTPCPPRAHVKKARLWQRENYVGVLVKPLLPDVSHAVQSGCCIEHYGPGGIRTITISKEGA